MGVCPACRGKGEITQAFGRVREAAKRMKQTDPDFREETPDQYGTTDYSLAAYFWHRGLYGRDGEAPNVRLVRGRPAVGSVAAGHEVDVFFVTPREGVGPEVYAKKTYRGFCWGYGGEGPSGLAAVLADLGLFPTLEDARRFVASLPMEDPWVLEGPAPFPNG